jgi:hypothetical protein
MGGQCGRIADDGDDHRLEAGGSERATKHGQGVDPAVGVQESGVEVFLAGLLLL